MRRFFLLCSSFLLFSSFAFSQEREAKSNDFDIFIDKSLGLTSAENIASNGYIPRYSFTDKGNTYKLSFILDRLEEKEKIIAKDLVYGLLEGRLRRIKGVEVPQDQISRYEDDEAENISNAEMGINAFLNTGNLDAQGRTVYDFVSVFFKREYGIVYQSIQAANLDFFKSTTFMLALQSFKYPGYGVKQEGQSQAGKPKAQDQEAKKTEAPAEEAAKPDAERGIFGESLNAAKNQDGEAGTEGENEKK